MTEMFDEVLAICLDRLTAGDSIDQCVAEYPKCPELRETLEVAELLRARSAAPATPRWLRRARFRMVAGLGLRGLRPTG